MSAPISSVAEMKQSDLSRRVEETRAKLAAQPKSQVKACDCMQGQPHSHGAESEASVKVPTKNGALIRTIPVGPLQCNMTIIADPVTKDATLVDPGGDAAKILALIAEMGVTVKQIIVTHAHFDHFLAADDIRKETKAPVLLHQADAMLWGALPMQCAMFGIPSATVSAPDAFLTDGMSLAVRDGTVIHTPGHSPGSCCFYFPNDNLLCSGDTLFRQSVGRTDLMGGDSATLVRSIQTKLYTLPGSTHVIPGHGPSTTIEFEAKHNSVVKAKASAL